MNRITFFVALIMGFCLQPVAVFAQDQLPNPKDAKAAPHPSKERPKEPKQAQKQNQRADVTRSDKSNRKSDATFATESRRSTEAVRQSTETNSRSVQQTTQRQFQSTTVAVQGNRSNHYNGQWVSGDTHSDWDRNGRHEWNNHNYRWYDGGWLIINVDSPGYYETGSLVIRVKQSLAQQGYYNGHFTETVGPHTRQAISNYQSDKGLQVNGEIDGPLLSSLGLE